MKPNNLKYSLRTGRLKSNAFVRATSFGARTHACIAQYCWRLTTHSNIVTYAASSYQARYYRDRASCARAAAGASCESQPDPQQPNWVYVRSPSNCRDRDWKRISSRPAPRLSPVSCSNCCTEILESSSDLEFALFTEAHWQHLSTSPIQLQLQKFTPS